ncbi:MAG TPA: hypothetical protein VGD67_28870, partial [Pseudonocardiaceae bacterium]
MTDGGQECRRDSFEGWSRRHLDPARPGAPRRASLATVPEVVLGELARSARGVIVLAVDGLGHRVAQRVWPGAALRTLTGTVPSTSATAWLTALTGAAPAEHGAVGMAYRAGDSLVLGVTGAVLAGDPRPRAVLKPLRRTVFERSPRPALALARELDHLPGPWAPALLRGARRAPAVDPDALAAQASDPRRLAEAVAAQVSATADRGLAWVYVNLDEYVHAHGFDEAVHEGMAALGAAAADWARAGWTVLAHSDHGQVPVAPDPALARAWAALDTPDECELPAGG